MVENMVIKSVFFAVLLSTATVQLVDSQDSSTWGDGGPDLCDIRWPKTETSPANTYYLCAEWSMPDIRDDPDFFRVFSLITNVEEYNFNFRGGLKRCASQWKYWPNGDPATSTWSWKFSSMCAERIAYANFFLVGAAGEKSQLIKKGTFGPIYMGGMNTSLSWPETSKIPGIRKIENIYATFKFFVPEIRVNFQDPKFDYDPTIKDWLTIDPKKTDFKVAVSLSVTCRDEEKNCEPPVKSPDYEVMHSYYPKRSNAPNVGFRPTIKMAYLEINKFHFELETWSEDRNDELYIINRLGGSWVGACKPLVQFVLYDSNPTPHGHCDDENSRWAQPNGEIRAVFTQFSGEMTKYSDSDNMQFLNKTWDFELNSSNWNEDQLRFLAEWQKPQPAGLDDRDIVWYKNWAKDTGMKVAFAYCTCSDATESRLGCIEYIHQRVDIRGRDWLK